MGSPVTGPDRFPLPADHPRRAEHLLLTDFLEEANRSGVYPFGFRPQRLTTGQALLARRRREQCALAVAAAERWSPLAAGRIRDIDDTWIALQGLMRALTCRKLPFTAEELAILLRFVKDRDVTTFVPVKALLRQVEACVEREGLPPGLRDALRALRGTGRTTHEEAEILARLLTPR